MILKTITFNMCHGEGLDGIIDVERQAKFLKKYKPDILFLQGGLLPYQRLFQALFFFVPFCFGDPGCNLSV